MAENISFRSAVNGFNRNEVLSYIKTLYDEKNSLFSELEALKAQMQEKETELAALREELGTVQKSADAQELEKQNEIKLGRAMFDARRYSDLIVSEAREKANAMFGEASAAAMHLADQVQEVNGEVEALVSSFNASLSDVIDQLSTLSASLSGFGAGAQGQNEVFNGNYIEAGVPTGENDE